MNSALPSAIELTGSGQPSAVPILSFDGIAKVFPTAATDDGFLRALEPVNLAIERGSFVTLVGPSGCGKSTLLMIAAALLEPTNGSVLYKGRRMTEPSREFGVMFQTPVLFPWRTVEKNVLLPAEIGAMKVADIRPRARRILELVGLSEFLNAYPNQLSGGMQQRAALARVLAYQPTVLLMDEPFGALDEFTREAMNLELMRLTDEAGITVLFVTHNIPEAVFLADEVVVMSPRPGRVVGTIPVSFPRPRGVEMMRDPAFTELTFEVRSMLSGSER